MSKRLISICLVMVGIMFSVSAATQLQWSWSNTDAQATYFRYQLDGGEIVETTDKVVYSKNDGKPHAMNIWQSFDGKTWSEATECVYTPEAKASVAGKTDISVLLSPYSFQDIVFLEDLYNIPSNYGFGLDLDGTYHLTDTFRAGMEASFHSYSLSDKALFDRLSDVSVGINAGYQMNLKSAVVYSDASAGVMLDFIKNHALVYGYVGVKTGAELPLVENLTLKAELAGKFAYQLKGSHSASFNLIATPSVGVCYTL